MSSDDSILPACPKATPAGESWTRSRFDVRGPTLGTLVVVHEANRSSSRIGRREPAIPPRTGCLSASHVRRERCFSRPLQPTLRTTTTRELSESGARPLSRIASHPPRRFGCIFAHRTALRWHVPLPCQCLAALLAKDGPSSGPTLDGVRRASVATPPLAGIAHTTAPNGDQWALSATPQRSCRPRTGLRERLLAPLSRRVFEANGVCQEFSSPGEIRADARQHASPTPLQDAFHRKETTRARGFQVPPSMVSIPRLCHLRVDPQCRVTTREREVGSVTRPNLSTGSAHEPTFRSDRVGASLAAGSLPGAFGAPSTRTFG